MIWAKKKWIFDGRPAPVPLSVHTFKAVVLKNRWMMFASTDEKLELYYHLDSISSPPMQYKDYVPKLIRDGEDILEFLSTNLTEKCAIHATKVERSPMLRPIEFIQEARFNFSSHSDYMACLLRFGERDDG